jgi:hypothetical protein
MALRQVRGIFPGLLSQEDPGFDVYHYLDVLPLQGKVTESGLVTVPVAGPVGGRPGDAIASPTDVPSGPLTKEAAKQGEPETGKPFPWVPVAALAALLFL